MSREFKTIWVPFQFLFDETVRHAPANYQAADGVHPTIAGSHLMAADWLKTVFTI